MALSFLYIAFVRILHLFRLLLRGSEELAIEVVVLRHEVIVLRRQVARPVLRPSDRALLAGLSRFLTRRRSCRFFLQPQTLLGWHRTWSDAGGPIRTARDGRVFPHAPPPFVLQLARENPT